MPMPMVMSDLHEEAGGRQHAHAAVCDLGFAPAINLILRLALEQIQWIEVAHRRGVALQGVWQ